MIIGLTGTISSGKGKVAEYLVSKGFIQLIYSDEIKKELMERKLEITRENLQNLGNEMREKFGADYWTMKLLENVSKGKNYVLDGARNPGELVPLIDGADSIIIGLDAPFEKRVEWLIGRSDKRDLGTREEIVSRLKRDMGEGENENGQQSLKCYEIANVKIYNDKTLKDLIVKVNEVIKI